MRARIASGLLAMGASLPSVVPRSGSWGFRRRQCAMAPSVVPEVLDEWMRPFRCHFTAAVWRHGLVLVAGAVLAPGRRTVAAALRVMGFAEAAGFAAYHRVLSHGHWCSRALAQRLLLLLVAAFVPHGPVVVGLDDTIERRRGKRINAKGIYRDAVRSSRGHFVKASGLRWLCVMLLAPVPWAGCVWGLPFLAVLAPSERYAAEQGKRHKKLTDWGRQALLQVARWLPGRRVVAVADSSFSAIALLRDLAPHLTVVTRLRLDACLCQPPPPRRPRTRGRPPVKGARLPSLAERVRNPRTPWRRIAIDGWYGRTTRRLDIASGTALWYHPGVRVAIRWVLVRDPTGKKEPQAFLCTDQQVEPADILRWFVRRWRTETTFEEARRHLGMETQRQWSDLAVLRTTPALLALFSLVTLWGSRLAAERGPMIEYIRWYPKPLPTFSDALALVRRELRTAQVYAVSPPDRTAQNVPADLINRLLLVACRPP